VVVPWNVGDETGHPHREESLAVVFQQVTERLVCVDDLARLGVVKHDDAVEIVV
jgi:hypothetical protein